MRSLVRTDRRDAPGWRRSGVVPRTLYFDIDGTLVHQTFGRAKGALAGGRFEALARRAGFDRLVCVSDAVSISGMLFESGQVQRPQDALAAFFSGTIRDDGRWLDGVELVEDPIRRCAFIDDAEDWYYVDDHAEAYLDRDRPDLLATAVRAGRVLPCDGSSDGREVARWLRSIGAGARTPYAA